MTIFCIWLRLTILTLFESTYELAPSHLSQGASAEWKMRQIPAVYLSNHLLFPPGHRARLHFPDSFEVWFLYGGIMASGVWVEITYAHQQAWLRHPPTYHPPFFLFSCLQLKENTPGSRKGRAMRWQKPKKSHQESQPSRNSHSGFKCVSEISLCCVKPLNSWGCLLQQWACPNTWNNYGLLSIGSRYM